MKTKFISFAMLCLSVIPQLLRAQNVGINNDNTAPASSAMLDVKSTSKGILIPRMTTAQRSAIATPVNGLMVYDITTNTFWFYKNTVWAEVTGNITLPYNGTHNANDNSFKVTNLNAGAYAYAIVGNSHGYGTAIAGTADSVGDGVNGSSIYGAGVSGFSQAGPGGSFSTDGNAAGVTGFSSDGKGASFESAGDSAGVYGLSVSGPGGEFKSTTGPAIKARGNVEILKSRLHFTGDPSASFTQGIEFTNAAGSALNGFLGKYNDSIIGFYGYTGGGWKTLFNNTNGNVGLQGNTNPRAPLSFASSTGNKIALWGSADAAHYGIGVQGGTLQLYSGSVNDNIALGYGNSTAFTQSMLVKGNGNVEISGTVKIAGGTPGTGKVLTSDATGNATWQSPATIAPAAFVADRSGGDVIVPTNSGWTKIPFNPIADYIQGTAYNAANSEFTVPANGLYHFDVKLLYNGFTGTTTNTGEMYIALYIRTAALPQAAYAVYEYTFIPTVPTYFTQGFSTTINLAAGDIIDVRVGNDSNGSITVTGLNITGLRTHFSGYRVM